MICEKCNVEMIVKSGQHGQFWACPNYPNCTNTKPIAKAPGAARVVTPSIPEVGGGFPEVVKPKPQVKAYPKDPVGLAVEVLGTLDHDGTELGVQNAMATAIHLVKQAKEAFE